MEMRNAEERVDLNSAEKALTFRLQRLEFFEVLTTDFSPVFCYN